MEEVAQQPGVEACKAAVPAWRVQSKPAAAQEPAQQRTPG